MQQAAVLHHHRHYQQAVAAVVLAAAVVAAVAAGSVCPYLVSAVGFSCPCPYSCPASCHPFALIIPYSSLSTLYDLIWSMHLSQSLFIPIHFHSLHISLYALLHTTKTVFDPSYTIQTMHYKINKQQTYNIRHQSILCIWLGHQ